MVIINCIFLIFSLVKICKFSDCTNFNFKIDSNDPDPTLNECIGYEYDNETNCCFLEIQDNTKKINRCIEIKDLKDEDEINRKLDVFKVMFKNSEGILINCHNNFLNIKFLSFILFIFYLFY